MNRRLWIGWTSLLCGLLLVAAVVNRHDVGTGHVARAIAGSPR